MSKSFLERQQLNMNILIEQIIPILIIKGRIVEKDAVRGLPCLGGLRCCTSLVPLPDHLQPLPSPSCGHIWTKVGGVLAAVVSETRVEWPPP